MWEPRELLVSRRSAHAAYDVEKQLSCIAENSCKLQLQVIKLELSDNRVRGPLPSALGWGMVRFEPAVVRVCLPEVH